MKNLNLKTALTAVTLAAATFATPLYAHASDYNRQCNDTTNSVAGGLIGGSVGAVVGEQIAGRRDRTEGAVIGAILGGLAGAAIGDGASDCEKIDVRTTSRIVTPASRVVTTPRVVTTQRVVTNNRGFSNSSFGNRGVTTNVSYGSSNRINVKDRLYRIDCEIDELRRERVYLSKSRRGARGLSSSAKRRLVQIDYKLDELAYERKRIKNLSHSRRAY